MTEIRQITCIRCPMGCLLTVEITDGVVTKVTGNQCKRGEEYAKTECVNPVRTLTTTIHLTDGGILPVRSEKPLPKASLDRAVKEIKALKIQGPVEIGAVLAVNVAGTGVSVIATDSVE